MHAQQPMSSYILLTIPKAHLHTSHESLTGTLSLECINTAHKGTASNDTHRDAYIVLHVAGKSFPIDPATPMAITTSDAGERTYAFRPSSSEKAALSEIVISVPEYTNDVEMLDNVLTQYGEQEIHEGLPPPTYGHATEVGNVGIEGKHLDDPSLRGKLVLMDEASGDVVGQLPQKLHFNEDPALGAEDRKLHGQKRGEAGPVVLELPGDLYDAYTSGKGLEVGEELYETREVFVRAIPPDEQDWMTKGATVIRHVYSTLLSATRAYTASLALRSRGRRLCSSQVSPQHRRTTSTTPSPTHQPNPPRPHPTQTPPCR